MSRNIIIGTTAINRPELHNDVMPDWLRWICNLREEYKIKWFINIDMVDRLNATYDDTMNNFIRLAKKHDRLDVTFLRNEEGGGNFLKACKRVSENIVKYHDELSDEDIEFVRVIWLEDDWKLNYKCAHNINELIDNYSTERSHINLTFIRNNYIWALAPSIMGYNIWRRLHYTAWKNQEDMIDPEHCVGLYYLKTYGEEKLVNNLTVVGKKIKNLEMGCFNYTNSRYTYSDDTYNIGEDSRYIDRDDVKFKFGNRNLFVRITPNFSIGGCKYGREFMKKHGLYKTHIQTNDNKNFYGESTSPNNSTEKVDITDKTSK